MSTSVETQGKEFWKDLPTMMGCFGPIVSRMQKHAWISSESLMRDIGMIVGANTVNIRTAGKVHDPARRAGRPLEEAGDGEDRQDRSYNLHGQ